MVPEDEALLSNLEMLKKMLKNLEVLEDGMQQRRCWEVKGQDEC